MITGIVIKIEGIDVVSKAKWQKLYQWMIDLNIDEKDINEQFIIGSGSGGQNLHKTASTVLLCYDKKNIQIKCQASRSQETNRYYARYRLCEKIDELINDAKSQKQKEIEKIRKQKRKRKKRHKDIVDKKQKSALKSLRKTPPISS